MILLGTLGLINTLSDKLTALLSKVQENTMQLNTLSSQQDSLKTKVETIEAKIELS